MTAPAQSPYRVARKTFIAACEGAGLDVIGRVHPSLQAPDGKPLFLDSAAMGPRDAVRGVMLMASESQGAGQMVELMRGGIALPPGARLVLVHALAAQADPAWLAAMLASVATEDLARAKAVDLLILGAAPDRLADALQQSSVVIGTLPADDLPRIRAKIDAVLTRP